KSIAHFLGKLRQDGTVKSACYGLMAITHIRAPKKTSISSLRTWWMAQSSHFTILSIKALMVQFESLWKIFSGQTISAPPASATQWDGRSTDLRTGADFGSNVNVWCERQRD